MQMYRIILPLKLYWSNATSGVCVGVETRGESLPTIIVLIERKEKVTSTKKKYWIQSSSPKVSKLECLENLE